MTSKKHDRSAGGYALARCGRTQQKISEEVGVSYVTVHQWINGIKKPGPTNRERMKELYDVTESLWDEPYQRAKAAGPTRARTVDDAAAAGGAFAMARSLQRQAQSQLDALEHADEEEDEKGNPVASWTPAEKAQVTQRLASTINVLAKLTGQYELGRRLMQLPTWKVLERELFEALKAFPDAAKSVAERLERFERDWVQAE